MAEQSTLRGRLWNAKRDARKRGLRWELSDRAAIALFKQPCHWCGAPPLNGIDRVNNERFYRPANTVACCKDCNRMKHCFRPADWLKQITRILYWHFQTCPSGGSTTTTNSRA
jgi:hypothetical protein